mgnify:CR=1 FL=1
MQNNTKMTTQITPITAITAFEKLKDATGHHTEMHTLKVLCHLLTEKCKAKDEQIAAANKNAIKWRDQTEELLKQVMALNLENHKLALKLQEKQDPEQSVPIKRTYQEFDYSSSDEDDE